MEKFLCSFCNSDLDFLCKMAMYIDDMSGVQGNQYLPVFNGHYPYHSERMLGFQPRLQPTVLQPAFGRDVWFDTRQHPPYLVPDSVPVNDFTKNESQPWMFWETGGVQRVSHDSLQWHHSGIVKAVPNANFTDFSHVILPNQREIHRHIDDKNFSWIKQEHSQVDDYPGKLCCC